MVYLLPAIIFLKYPLTFLKSGKSMSVMQEGSNIDTKNYYTLVITLNAEAHGVDCVRNAFKYFLYLGRK
jgi:hypothetical protein